MNKENLKTKVKGFWDNNKGKIITVGALAGTVVGTVIAIKQNKETKELIEQVTEIEETKFDLGRDCIITYSVEDTGEVLWEGLCTERYVEDVKESDMEYEAFRKLNGLE